MVQTTSYFRRSLEEHKTLRGRVEKLDRLGEEFWQARLKITELIGKVETELDEFIPLLERHFSVEEGRGLHDEIVEALPNQTPQVQQLLDEHRMMMRALGEVRGVIAVLKGMARCEQPLVYDRLRTALDTLKRHEADEHTLFMTALEGEGQAPD